MDPIDAAYPPIWVFIGRNGGSKRTLGKSINVDTQPHDYFRHSIKAKSKKCAEFKSLYETGLSLSAISRRTGQSKTKVLTELCGAGVAMRTPSRGCKRKQSRTKAMRAGTIPFGFTYLEGRLVVEPSEYRIVLEMTRLSTSGQSLRAIARNLNDRCVATRYDKKWSHEVIKQIIERHENQFSTKEK